MIESGTTENEYSIRLVQYTGQYITQ